LELNRGGFSIARTIPGQDGIARHFDRECSDGLAFPSRNIKFEGIGDPKGFQKVT
jgi:hypothetical protein